MTTELQASVNIANKVKIKADMLVQDVLGNIGVVTKVTRKWAHVTMLIWAIKPLMYQHENYHMSIPFRRKELNPIPLGTKISLKQKEVHV